MEKSDKFCQSLFEAVPSAVEILPFFNVCYTTLLTREALPISAGLCILDIGKWGVNPVTIPGDGKEARPHRHPSLNLPTTVRM